MKRISKRALYKDCLGFCGALICADADNVCLDHLDYEDQGIYRAYMRKIGRMLEKRSDKPKAEKL